MLAATTLSLILALSAPPQAGGGTRPDFSGKWKVVPSVAAAGVAMGSAPPALSASGTMGSGWPDELTIAQTDAALNLEYTYFHPREVQPPFRFNYVIGGAENRTAVNIGRGPQVQLTRVQWDGDRLVITTTHAFVNPSDGRAMTTDTKQTLTLDAAAGTMTVGTFRSGVLGGKSSTTITVYRR
jgi:hypothetical protein